GHALEMARVLVEVGAVLDRVDPGFDGDVETAAAERMAHDAAVEGLGLVAQRLHLVEVERRVERAVARPRAGAAGGGAFDDVGTGPDHLAHHLADLVDAVADALWQ